MKKLLCLVVILGLMFVVTEQIRLSHQESEQERDGKIEWLNQTELINKIVQHGHFRRDQNTLIPLDKTLFRTEEHVIGFYDLFRSKNKNGQIAFIPDKDHSNRVNAQVSTPRTKLCLSLPFETFEVDPLVGIPFKSFSTKHVKFVLQKNSQDSKYKIITAFPIADYNKELKPGQKVTQNQKNYQLPVPVFITSNFDITYDKDGKPVKFVYDPNKYANIKRQTQTNTNGSAKPEQQKRQQSPPKQP